MKAGQIAEGLGVGRRTVYKWLARYHQGGARALDNRTSRPRKSPRCRPVEQVATMAALRGRRLSSLEIAFSLSLPIFSVMLELRRLKLNKLPGLEQKPPVIRKAERFTKTSLKEWAYKNAYESSAEREEYLKPWLEQYNYRRPHTSLNHKPPISRLVICEQPPC